MRRKLGLFLLVLAFFAMRLPSLRLLPLYSDEGLGIWRAERVLEGSLTRGAGEGKPLHAWMIAAAIALPGDDIRAARAAHVVAGALLLIALWDVTRRQLSPAAAWIAAALWIALPFPAIFERTVTPDVPLAAAGVAAIACAFRVAAPDGGERQQRRWRFLLFASGAVALFTKMPIGVVPAALPLLVPLALPAADRAAARMRLRGYAIALAATVALLAAIVAVRSAIGVEPLGFGVHEFGKKVAVVRDLGDAPRALTRNLSRVGEFAWLYLGPIGIVLLVAGVIGAWVARDRVLRLLSTFALAWTAIFAGTAGNLSAHYLLAAVPFLVMAMAWAAVAAARGVQRGGERPLVTAVVAGALALSVLVWAWPFHRALWKDPTTARLAHTERLQYVSGDWSGYGFPEAALWVEKAMAQGRGVPVFVTLHLADYERLRLYASETARRDIVQVQVDRYTLRVPHMIERVQALEESGRHVLLVVGSDGLLEPRWRRAFPMAKLRTALPKPGGDRSVVVYEVQPRSLFGAR